MPANLPGNNTRTDATLARGPKAIGEAIRPLAVLRWLRLRLAWAWARRLARLKESSGYAHIVIPLCALLLPVGATAQDVFPPGPAALADSGPVTATVDGQIIENLRITANGAPGITINGKLNVIVRNVEIHHTGGPGISIAGGSHFTHVQNVNIIHEGAPPAGPNSSSSLHNILCRNSNDVSISFARLRRGSSGIWAGSCQRIHAQFIEGYDFRGPFPRGQLFQVDHSHDAILEDFYTQNPINTAWTEDNVNIWRSSNAIVRRGLIDGNNSPSGQGVILEHDDDIAHTALVEDVDTIRMGNGSFSAAHAREVTFRRVRARDNTCGDLGGRGASLSNSLMFASFQNQLSYGIRYFAAEWWNSCNGNIAWDRNTMEVKEFTQVNYTQRPALHITFSWERQPPPPETAISVSPPSVTFTGVERPPAQTVVVNVTNGAPWSSFDACPFFNAIPTAGSAGSSQTLTPSAGWDALAPGTHTCPITYSAPGNPNYLVVTVTGNKQPATLLPTTQPPPPPPPPGMITVVPSPTPPQTAPLSANPTSIVQGNSSTLTWSSTNATRCRGTNFKPTGTAGSVQVSPSVTTTYLLTCTGAGGTAVSGTTVTVTTPTLGIAPDRRRGRGRVSH
jgi:hypothetical protein